MHVRLRVVLTILGLIIVVLLFAWPPLYNWNLAMPIFQEICMDIIFRQMNDYLYMLKFSKG